MNEHHSSLSENESTKSFDSLVERLDPSIGELSTVTGAMVTELLRRTLRGSVRQIDEELQGQVAQRVDATIAQRLPAIEQSAADAAEKTAREAATEVAVEEMHALEQRARESERDIVARIETSARAAEHQTVESARALTGKIELVEKQAELAIAGKAHELADRIEETARSAATMADEKARELARHIEEAERRATEAFQAELTRQVEDLTQRSRKTAAGIKDRLQTLDATTAALHKQLLDEAGNRADVDRRVKETGEHIQKLEQARQTAAEQFRLRYEALAARVAELEKPRGLRALWAWLFSRRQAKPAVKEAVARGDENKPEE
ncbi:MAG TPA: hypothetical protein VNX28_05140 [Gemmataceae bacterium]|nr:hypothetical protein [Gemmataceae bacterium]